MRPWRYILLMLAGVLAALAAFPAAQASGTRKVASGKTQVVAKVDGREITISDLRSEMARLGLSPNNQDAERVALENIVNRRLLASAARAANFHRQPEALRRMAAAQEQALADLYVTTASQPPEPTRAEIEDYIAANPTLFASRKIYNFTVLRLPTEAFDPDKQTPLFDDAKDFSALAAMLKETGVVYAEAPVTQLSSAFPEPVRLQLAQYSLRDNIVIKGDGETQIMKITGVRDAPAPASEAPAFARQYLLQQAGRERAERLLASLKKKSSLSYYRASAAPVPAREAEK